MFCFISSLRAPATSADWPRVCELFERTAISVFNQTCGDFRFLVACHEKPKLSQKFDERLEFIVVNFPEPKRTHRPASDECIVPDDDYPRMRVEYDWSWHPPGMSADYPYMARDKLAKLLCAMDRARALKAHYVMSLDADDLVHKSLASYIVDHPDVDGWYVERGWRYAYGSRWIETLDGFNHVCGSCNILSHRCFSFPREPERERDVDAQWFREGHTQFVAGFTMKGAAVAPIPFRAGVYITQHPESFSRIRQQYVKHELRPSQLRRAATSLKKVLLTWRKRRACNRSIRRDFAINCSALSSRAPVLRHS